MFRNNPFGFIVSVALIIAGIGVLILFMWWLSCIGTTLTVTDKRTTLRKGILSKNITDVYHSDIRNVQLNQGLMQRIFNVGAIAIASAGTGAHEIVVSGLPDPEKIKDFIDQYRTIH